MGTKVVIEGAIGESTPLFTMKLETVKELDLDMSKTTYINSIGVKEWINWTLRIPRDCHVKMIDAPFVIASQASQVIGFVTPRITIQSIRAPFVCESCNFEESRLLVRGKDYEYGSPGKSASITIPENQPCGKCKKETLEPDFMIDKSFKFLTPITT